MLVVLQRRQHGVDCAARKYLLEIRCHTPSGPVACIRPPACRSQKVIQPEVISPSLPSKKKVIRDFAWVVCRGPVCVSCVPVACMGALCGLWSGVSVCRCEP